VTGRTVSRCLARVKEDLDKHTELLLGVAYVLAALIVASCAQVVGWVAIARRSAVLEMVETAIFNKEVGGRRMLDSGGWRLEI